MRLYRNQPSGTVDRLRELRRNATGAEKALLHALKEAFPACKWRFQAPIGPYRVDFLCFAERLAIEVDGATHAEAVAYDEARTRFIEREGYRVLRFWNNDVLGNLDGVIEVIATSLSRREREEAPQAQKGEGDQEARATLSPSPSHAAMRRGPLPLLMGEA